MKEEVPELLVEKLVLGELSESEASRVRARLGAGVEERIAAVGRSNAEILARHPPEQIAAGVRRRLEHARPTNSRAGFWLAVPTLAAAAGVAVWIGSREVDHESVAPARAQDLPPQDVRLKGDPRLVIERYHDGQADTLVDGDSVRVGDRLQLSYQAGGRRQGVILSFDGRGVITLHHPSGPEAATALASIGLVPLDDAYELDDAPRFERFFFVTGDAVDVQTVSSAAVRLSKRDDAETAPLPLPARWQQSSILLHKP